MTGDRWLTLAYLLWLCLTGFAVGVLVGRQWMRNTIAKALEDAVDIAVVQFAAAADRLRTWEAEPDK